MRRACGLTLMVASAAPLTTLAAQDQSQTSSTAPPDDGRVIIDLTQPTPEAPFDTLAAEQCEEEADAGRITNEIIVCRQLGDTTDGVYNHEDFIRRYAEATQGIKTPNVDGPGIFRGPATVSGLCFIPPCPAPPALIIDVEALPDAPAGSDADRIAKGLPPLGEDGDAGRGPINQEELGLPEPSAP